MMDWIIEHEAFFFGMAVGAFLVLCVSCVVLCLLHREVKYLEGIGTAHYERTNRENDAD